MILILHYSRMEAIVEAVYRDEPFPVEMTNDMLDQLDPRHGRSFITLTK